MWSKNILLSSYMVHLYAYFVTNVLKSMMIIIIINVCPGLHFREKNQIFLSFHSYKKINWWNDICWFFFIYIGVHYQHFIINYVKKLTSTRFFLLNKCRVFLMYEHKDSPPLFFIVRVLNFESSLSKYFFFLNFSLIVLQLRFRNKPICVLTIFFCPYILIVVQKNSFKFFGERNFSILL